MSEGAPGDQTSDQPARAGAGHAADGHSPPHVLVIGQSGPLSDAAGRALEAGGARVSRLSEPGDAEIRAALEEGIDTVLVISRDDVASLRLALVVAHIRPGIRLLVTIFGREVAGQVEARVENVTVLSMGDIVGPAFAGPCLDPELISLTVQPEGRMRIETGPEGPRRIPMDPRPPGRIRRALAHAESALMPFDVSARILVVGLAGFATVLAVETVVTALVGGLGPIEALYTAAKVTVTVGPSEVADRGPGWFKLFSAIAMLLVLGFTAVLTAGLVNRLLDTRLTGLFGRFAVPRRDHVVVVGLGQVGLRLCELFRDLGIPVVAVENDDLAPNIPRAKEQRIPVVIGRGERDRLLRRLSLGRARALAAVTSDELANIAISVAALGVRGDLPIALRAGDGEATHETRSLFGIGVVRDVYRIAGTALAAAALGHDTREAFPYRGTLYLVDGAGRIEPFVPAEGVADEAVPGARAGPGP